MNASYLAKIQEAHDKVFGHDLFKEIASKDPKSSLLFVLIFILF